MTNPFVLADASLTRRLRLHRPGWQVDTSLPVLRWAPPSSASAVVALSLGRPGQDAVRAQAEAIQHGLPFLPVFGAGGGVHLGPLVRPGTPGCLTCLLARERQHALHQSLYDASSVVIDDHPIGLDKFVLAAVSAVEWALDERLGALAEPGAFVAAGGRDGPLRGAVVPVHGCADCSRSTRSLARVRTAVLWP
jgi:bacteriocin biosynthesis cyclodehydratase domain-containing protein